MATNRRMTRKEQAEQQVSFWNFELMKNGLSDWKRKWFSKELNKAKTEAGVL